MDVRTHPLLAGLNEPQKRAVQYIDGPLLVLAGPGSGKTRVITHRAAWLVHHGVAPRNILAITFTNKAAQQMRERIGALGVAGGMWIHTFHALGVRLLREFGPLVDVQPGFTIYDEADQAKVLEDAYAAAGVRESLLRYEVAQNAISAAKNALTTPAEYASTATFGDSIAIARVYEAYEQILRQRNAVDFDDLLMRVAMLLRRSPHVTESLNERFRYVLIDEYQDTNRAQYVIARELTSRHNNICATGDPDQSIYAWRGADIGNILAFERDYPDAVVVRLEQNYRSTGHILRVADQLISNNRQRKAKRLWTESGPGEPVQVWRFNDGREEAERIAATIAEQVRQGRSWSDFAIFYRVNAVSRGLEESLRFRGIPYRIARGVEFYNRKEIKDALAYLRALINPADEVAWLRCINTPARGIGKTTIERIQQAAAARRCTFADVLRDPAGAGLNAGTMRKVADFVALMDSCATHAQQLGVADTVNYVIERSGLRAALRDDGEAGGEDRVANLDELVSAARRYEEEQPDEEEISLLDFLQRVSLASDQDAVDNAAGCVMLMTLHTAKGLEFPVVFLAGLEHGLLPHERALSGNGDVEEERRLCFVGITRARERLYLSYAEQRLLRGQLLPRIASQFVRELTVPDAVESCDFTDRFRGRRAWEPRGDEEGYDEYGDAAERPRRRFGQVEEEPVFSMDDSARAGGRTPPPPRDPAPAGDWREGMLVQHAVYGPGMIMKIMPAGSRTRAEIKFAGLGIKTFVLEAAPLSKLF
jgi:DNA helicase-2/ATP-dependent DNA helicase PcrA